LDRKRGSKLTDLDERIVERYLHYRARKRSIQPGDRAALKRFLSVLRNAGIVAPATPPPISPQDKIFEAFADWLRTERGLAPKSIVRQLPVIRRFLREVCPDGASELGKIQPGGRHALHRTPRSRSERGIWEGDVLVPARISQISSS
jgi:hypothetical protein